MRELSVGFVAKRSGVNVSTLHFYEQKGLIVSWRNQGNQRRYHPDVIRRVSIIKAAQRLGISLLEIKQAFAALPANKSPSKKQWQALAQGWQQRLNKRINQLETLRDSLDSCIGCGCLSLTHCPIYNPNDELAEQGPGPVILDRE